MLQKLVFLVLWYLSTPLILLSSPLVTNYTKSQYGAGSKNWSVVQDEQGYIYVGNDQGLLEYDGSRWGLFQLPNKLAARALATHNDRIYVGSYEEFGYFDRDSFGHLHYTSLSDSLVDFDFHNEDIWKIWIVDDQVYFQAFGTVFCYTNDELIVLKPPTSLLFLFKAHGRIVGQLVGGGLVEIKDGQFQLIEGSEVLAGSSVLSISELDERSMLLGTSVNGFFIYDGKEFKRWENSATEFVKTYQLNNVVPYDEDHFAAGTILNGVILLNKQGEIIRHISKANGMQNNTVLGLMVDREKNLWVGLNHGIDHIELNSPYSFFIDKSGQIGSVHTAKRFNGRLYIGTNQGLFYKKWEDLLNFSTSAQDFQFVENSQGHVLEFSEFDGQLFCGHNRGTFVIENGDKMRRISEVTGGWSLCETESNNQRYLVQGTYTNLVVYKYDPGKKWTFSHRISGFSEPVKYVLFDNQGNLWASHAYKGVYKISIDDELQAVTSIKYYGRNEGFPNEFNVHMYLLRDQLVFSTGELFYTYDPLMDAIMPYEVLNNHLVEYSDTHAIINAGSDKFWLANEKAFTLTGFINDQLQVIEEHPYDFFNYDMVEGFENIVPVEDSTYVFCLHNGFALYDQRKKGQEFEDWKSFVYLREIACQDGALPIDLGEVENISSVQIPFAHNFVHFRFANPVYTRKDLKFQYKLEGLDENWTETTGEVQKEYTRLPPGDYRFVVRVMNYKNEYSNEAFYKFEVLPAWYADKKAMVLYAFLIISIFLIMRSFFKIRYEKRQELLRINLQKEKEEHLRQEALLSEKRLMELKNEKLEDEIKYKSRQLANSTIGIIKKNEVLIEIKNELSKEKSGNGVADSAEHVKKVMKIINRNLTGDEDWQVFESNFDQAHENFLKRIRKLYPELTPKDLRFCAYLRMNISSKEIASLLNISVRGVEIRRYRLRRKLGLPHDKNLVEFMLEM
ncbi:MAG: triple tyrosine motif-containing protein [Cyclobacteriaceae bacterium]